MLALTTRTAFELGYHRDLSRDSVFELSPDAGRLITNANLYVDIRSVVALFLRRKRHPLYRVHFDDCFGGSAFEERWAEVESLIARPPESPRGLARALGRAQHSGQDYYAHSNHVEQVTGHHPASFEPVTYATVMTEPQWGALRERWSANRTDRVADALLSGAYFTKAATVTNDRGEPEQLHHRTLNKEQPIIPGPYLYCDYDRTSMHFRALACARLESDRLVSLVEEAHPEAFAELRDYRSPLWERIGETLRYWFAVAAGIVTGHWR